MNAIYEINAIELDDISRLYLVARPNIDVTRQNIDARANIYIDVRAHILTCAPKYIDAPVTI